MNLLTDKWLPYTLDNGSHQKVTIEEALRLPLLNFQTCKPELNVAALLFLIGLRQTGFKPLPLLSGNKRFLQSLDARKRYRLYPIKSLLIESFTHKYRHHYPVEQLCGGCAALALYAHCLFAGAAGSGYYPGIAYCQALYFNQRRTVAETVEANLMPDIEIQSDSYFVSPNLYWLKEPESEGNCHICDSYSPVVTSFYREGKAKASFSPNPHVAYTINKKRYSIMAGHTQLDIIEGIRPDSEITVAPQVIEHNAKSGDAILCFSTFYKNGTALLERIVYERFIFPETFINRKVEKTLLQAIWYTTTPAIKLDYNRSTRCGEILNNYSNLVCSGLSPLESATRLYRLYSPEQDYREREKFPLWKYWLNKLEETASVTNV